MADSEATTSGAPMTVRSKKTVWLLGSEQTQLLGSKLPSNRQVLSVFFHHHNTLKKSIHESSRDVIRQVAVFWERARIPTRLEKHNISKLDQLHGKWTKLKKNAGRQTETQRTYETVFVEELDNLFDIAHMDAMTLITIQEDRDFLVAQREKGRRGCMGQVDKVLAGKESRTMKRRMADIERKQRSEMQKCATNKLATLESSSSDTDNITDANDDTDTNDITVDVSTPKPTVLPKKRAKFNIVTPMLAIALDRTKMSDRNATFVLAAAAQSLGHDVKDFNINHSSIHRRREQCRSEMASKLRDEFKSTVPLVVHWDGKLLKDLTGNELVDRLPVIVSGAGVDQLLGVPKLHVGSGESQASAVVRLLEEWRVVDNVKGMCFDTTSTNTGHRNGACVLIEQKLQKNLLHFACRHHVFELVLASVFSESMTVSSGPDVAIFKRFQQAWPTINQASYETGADNVEMSNILDETRGTTMTTGDSVMTFAMNQLLTRQPRDDYRVPRVNGNLLRWHSSPWY